MKTNPTMECPNCKEIEFEHIDTLTAKGKSDILEYKCSACGEYATFDGPIPEVKTIGIAWTRAAEEQEKQNWWHQQNQDNEWIEDNG